MWVGGGSRKKRALKLIWWHPCTHICSAVFPSKVYQSKGKGWYVSQWDISKSWMQAIVCWKVLFCTEFLTGIKRSKWCARMPIFYFIFLIFLGGGEINGAVELTTKIPVLVSFCLLLCVFWVPNLGSQVGAWQCCKHFCICASILDHYRNTC